MRGEPGDIEVEIADHTAKLDRGKISSIAFSMRFIMLSESLKLWVYIGRRADYIVVEGLYCSCGTFTRSLTRKPGCYHLAALEEARKLGRYRRLKAEPGDVERIVWECLNSGFSAKLRKILYTTGA